MFSLKISILVFVVLFAVFYDANAWRRRRRRRCTPHACEVSSWSSWSSCSVQQCRQEGLQRRTRTQVSPASCGGTDCPELDETRQCYGTRSVDCQLSSWSEWSACSSPCGVFGVKSSTRHKIVIEQCGGTCTSTLRKTQQCYGRRSVDCKLSSWSEWSACSTLCEVSGVQSSTRRKIVIEQCGGTCTSTLRKTRHCYGTRSVDCKLSSWSEWSTCSTLCGVSGVQSSTRRKIVTEQCGGTCTSTLRKTRACPELSCLHGGSLKYGLCLCAKGYAGDCCEQQCFGIKAVNCHLSSWSEWSACTTPCGVSGIQSSSRHRIIVEQCGGKCTDTFRKTRACPELSCLNGGSLKDKACFCKEGYAGQCCEKGKLHKYIKLHLIYSGVPIS